MLSASLSLAASVALSACKFCTCVRKFTNSESVPAPGWAAGGATTGGFTVASGGSNAVAQYAPPLAALFNDPERTPEKYLLWFHHLRWDRRMASGATLWDELVLHYTRGWQSVQQMRHTWAGLQRFVDAERYSQIAAFLAIQDKEARWWRDATLAYFQSISGLPFPPGTPPPQHTLDEYKTMSFPYAPGNPGWTAAPFADESH